MTNFQAHREASITDGGAPTVGANTVPPASPKTSIRPGMVRDPQLQHEELLTSRWVRRVIDNRYRVLEKIGSGGMGSVFVAEHMKLRQLVALKIIHPELAGNHDVALRFAREAMVTATLDHPNIISATDYGTLPEGGAYLVMRLVSGPSLRQQLEDHGPIPWRQACDIGLQISDALISAHKNGIVHRDLKPENVLLEKRNDGSWRAKVLDFGIARVSPSLLGPESSSGVQQSRALTRTGMIIGTPGYMAPEQATGGDTKEAADIYTLGVLLFEMVCDALPFDGPDLGTVIQDQLTKAPGRLAEVTGDLSIPVEFEELVQAMLKPKTKDRPQSAVEVHEALCSLAERSAQWNRPSAPLNAREASVRFSASHPGGTPLPKTSGVHETAPNDLLEESTQLFARAKVIAVAKEPKLHRLGTVLRGLTAFLLLIVSLGISYVVWAERPDDSDELISLFSSSDEFTRVRRGVPAKEARRAAESLPAPIRKQIRSVLESERWKDKRASAQWLLSEKEKQSIPEYAILASEMVAYKGCRSRSRALKKIAALGDRRAMPIVEYFDAQPKKGCGKHRKSDCYGCIRNELRAARIALK